MFKNNLYFMFKHIIMVNCSCKFFLSKNQVIFLNFLTDKKIKTSLFDI